MDPKTVAKIERRKDTAHTTKDGGGDHLVTDNNGTVIQRFRSLDAAQAFVNSQRDPDRYAIQRRESPAFDIKKTALELAESGEPDEEIIAEREFEQNDVFPA